MNTWTPNKFDIYYFKNAQGSVEEQFWLGLEADWEVVKRHRIFKTSEDVD
jgi:hypothetical protein